MLIYDPSVIKKELERKTQQPASAIMAALGCSQKTAYNKLRGVSDFTVPEALKIVDAYFADDDLSVKVLFAREGESA